MKHLSSIALFLMFLNLTNCSTAQKLQQNIPFTIDNVYNQHWVAGVKNGGSGDNLFIVLKDDLPKSIQLDSVYFKRKVAKLEVNTSNTKIFMGRFQTDANKTQDIVMDSDHRQEYGNKLVIKKQTIPFELNDNECVIGYKKQEKIKYFKIENVLEKQIEYLPTVPPKPN